jgi:hypothetical protein
MIISDPSRQGAKLEVRIRYADAFGFYRVVMGIYKKVGPIIGRAEVTC